MAEVEALRRRHPTQYREHKTTKFLALLVKIVMEDVPRAPDDDRFRQGKTLGGQYKFWRRAKFAGRFRLFFRYRSATKGGPGMIAYAYLNDEKTLRKAGGQTDVYAVFKQMLEQEAPPSKWEELVAQCEVWRKSKATLPPLGAPSTTEEG